MSDTNSFPARDLSFRQECLTHNLNRITDINLIFLVFIIVTGLINLFAIFVLKIDFAFSYLFKLLHVTYFIINLVSYFFIKHVITRKIILRNIRTFEWYVSLYIFFTFIWGAITTAYNQHISLQIMIYTLSLFISAALLYIPISQMIFITITSSTLLLFGIFIHQENVYTALLLGLYICTFDIIAILLSMTVHKNFKKAYEFKQRLILENMKNKVLTNQLVGLNHQLSFEADFDVLTKLFNRRGLNHYILKMMEEVRFQPTYVTVLVIDIDHFKKYNDYYGHTKGDIVLSKVAQALKQISDQYDFIIARWGGEEFLSMSCPHNHQITEILCQKLVTAVNTLHIPHEASSSNEFVSVSIGAATMKISSMQELEELVDQADQALYKVKETSRNGYAIVDLSD